MRSIVEGAIGFDWSKRYSAEQLAFAAAACALVFVFVFVQIIRSGEPLALDQGLFAAFGNWPGQLPYRDIFDSKPPLFLYTWTLAWNLGGSATAVWWFEALWLAASMGLMFALGARLCDRWVGLTAALLLFAGLWAPGFGGYWSRAQAEEFMVLPMLGAAWLAVSAIERERVAIWVGVLTGVVGLYKIPGMAVAAVWPALWLLSLGWRGSVKRVAWLTAGLVAPWMLMVGWFAAHGAAGDFYDGVFIYHRHNAEFISPPWSYVVRTFARTVWRELPVLLLAAGVAMVPLWRSRDRARALWLTAWVVLTMAPVVMQRQLAGYHYLLAVPGLALTAAMGVRWLASVVRAGPLAGRVAAAVGLCVLAGFTVRSVGDWRDTYGDGYAYRFAGMKRTAYLKTFERGIISPEVEERAARYLREHTKPGDPILVWGLAPAIYPLADRPPATKYPFHKVLLTYAPLSRMIPDADLRRAEFMKRFNEKRPVYILVGTRDRNPFEPLDSVSSLKRFPALAEIVQNDYKFERRIGRFVVLRLTY